MVVYGGRRWSIGFSPKSVEVGFSLDSIRALLSLLCHFAVSPLRFSRRRRGSLDLVEEKRNGVSDDERRCSRKIRIPLFCREIALRGMETAPRRTWEPASLPVFFEVSDTGSLGQIADLVEEKRSVVSDL